MAIVFGNKKKKKTAPVRVEEQPADLLGDNLNFDGIEAFNLLRTNLSFSFSDEKKCHVIGVTSPIPGTGKSLISTNMAYSIAKAGRKVLLIDGDLRLPTVATKMGIASKPGLSNILVSPIDPMSAVQHYNGTLDILVAGDIPPKPSELLGSDRMGNVLAELSEYYEYIILDLTPVTVVPDTLAVAKFLDGIVIILRKDHDEKRALDETLRQLELAKARILGIVFNSGSGYKSPYGNGYKKKKYEGKNTGKSGAKKSGDNYRYGAKPTMKENATAEKKPKPMSTDSPEKTDWL